MAAVMSTEQQLRDKIEELTNRVRELESQNRESSDTDLLVASPSLIQPTPKAKPDIFTGGDVPLNDWLSHFELCVLINGWSNDQACQQLAICLRVRGRAQRVYLTLHRKSEKATEGLSKLCE